MMIKVYARERQKTREDLFLRELNKIKYKDIEQSKKPVDPGSLRYQRRVLWDAYDVPQHLAGICIWVERLGGEGILPAVPVSPLTGCLPLSKLFKFSAPEIRNL